MTNVADDQKRSKLEKLHDYSKNNQAYLVNYEEEQQNKTYTSQVAESHTNLQSTTDKTQRKCKWTREGAHILQIRGMITSNEWDDDWQKTCPYQH